MSKKVDFDYIKSKFNESGIQILSETYVNNTTPLSCVCSSGHCFNRTWANFQQGSRCRTCVFQKRPQSKSQYSHEEVMKIFKINGCELLSEYRVKSDPLLYKCKCEFISKTTFYSFLKSKQCIRCAKMGDNNPNWNPDRKSVFYKKLFRTRCQWLVKNTLKSIDKKKKNKTVDLLGYNGEDLRKHLESFPNWINICQISWHIDHIFPVKAFVDYNINDVKIINCLENLQPISSHENHSKSSKYDAFLFEEWLIKKGIHF